MEIFDNFSVQWKMVSDKEIGFTNQLKLLNDQLEDLEAEKKRLGSCSMFEAVDQVELQVEAKKKEITKVQSQKEACQKKLQELNKDFTEVVVA